MAVMSEQQKDDLKMKIGLGALAIAIFGPMLLAGPLLEPVVLKHYMTKKLRAPGTPERVHQIGVLMLNTMREEKGLALLEQAYILFGNDHDSGDVDFTPVFEHGAHARAMESSYYMPWVVEAQPDGVRPDPVQVAKPETMAKILATVGQYYEDAKDYKKSNHIWICLDALWPTGTPAHRDGAEGLIRMQSRNYQ